MKQRKEIDYKKEYDDIFPLLNKYEQLGDTKAGMHIRNLRFHLFERSYEMNKLQHLNRAKSYIISKLIEPAN